MIVFDAHSDFLADITERRIKGERDVFLRKHIPKLKKGGVKALIGVVWVDPPYDSDPPARMLQILQNSFADLCPLDDVVFPVKNHREFKNALRSDKIAVVLGFEGLSGLESNPEGIYMLYNMGVRHASLTWNEGNAFASGVKSKTLQKGLTTEGKKVVRLIEELGMLLDVSHADEKTFWDIMNAASGPIMASHSNSYSLCPVPRNLKDDQIKAIVSTGGIVGINAWPEFVDKNAPSIDRLVDHIDYIVDKAGIDHVAFGFDFTDFLENASVASYEPGSATITPGIGRAEDIPNLISRLSAKGYTKQDIEKISFLNMENMFAKVVQ